MVSFKIHYGEAPPLKFKVPKVLNSSSFALWNPSSMRTLAEPCKPFHCSQWLICRINCSFPMVEMARETPECSRGGDLEWKPRTPHTRTLIPYQLCHRTTSISVLDTLRADPLSFPFWIVLLRVIYFLTKCSTVVYCQFFPQHSLWSFFFMNPAVLRRWILE